MQGTANGTTPPALLDVHDIHTDIDRFHILQGVSLQVPANEITVLLGRNGAGKTTTLKSIMGLTPPHSGEMTFGGRSLNGRATYEVAAMGIGYVPEHRAIFNDLSVYENLKLAERERGDLDRKEDFIFDLFPDLKRLIHLNGNQLSGGQQQMLSIARVLVPDNRLLLIDEPSEGLAPIIVEQMIEAMRQLRSESTVLLVEQNFLMAREVADHYYIIDNGRSVRAGMMADLVDDEATIQQYLGAA